MIAKLRKRDPDFPLSTGRKYEYSQPAVGAHVGMFNCETAVRWLLDILPDYTPDEISEILKVTCEGDTERWNKYRVQALKYATTQRRAT